MNISSYYEEWIEGQKWVFCIATILPHEYEVLKADEKNQLLTLCYSVDGFTYAHGDVTAYEVSLGGSTVYNIPLNRDTVVIRTPDTGFIEKFHQERGTK